MPIKNRIIEDVDEINPQNFGGEVMPTCTSMDRIIIDGKTMTEILQERQRKKPQNTESQVALDKDSFYNKLVRSIMEKALKSRKHVILFSQHMGSFMHEPTLLTLNGKKTVTLNEKDEQKIKEVHEKIKPYFLSRTLGELSSDYEDAIEDNDYMSNHSVEVAFQEIEEFPSEIKVGGNTYDLEDRLSIYSVLYMASLGNYTLEEIGDNSMRREDKLGIVREIKEHLEENDGAWFKEIERKGKKAIREKVERLSEEIDFTDPEQMCDIKNRGIHEALLCAQLCDAQSFDFLPGYADKTVSSANEEAFDETEYKDWIDKKVRRMRTIIDGALEKQKEIDEEIEAEIKRARKAAEQIEDDSYEDESSYEDEPSYEEEAVDEEMIIEEMIGEPKREEQKSAEPESEEGIEKWIEKVNTNKFIDNFKQRIEASIEELKQADKWLLTGSQHYKDMQTKLNELSILTKNMRASGSKPTKESFQSLKNGIKDLAEYVKIYQEYKADPKHQSNSQKERMRITAAGNLENLCREMSNSLNYSVKNAKEDSFYLHTLNMGEQLSPIYNFSVENDKAVRSLASYINTTVLFSGYRELCRGMGFSNSAEEKLAKLVKLEQIAIDRRRNLQEINQNRSEKKEELITEETLEKLTDDEKKKFTSGEVERQYMNSKNEADFVKDVMQDQIFTEAIKNMTPDKLFDLVMNNRAKEIAKQMDMRKQAVKKTEIDKQMKDLQKSQNLDKAKETDQNQLQEEIKSKPEKTQQVMGKQ